MPLLDFPDPLVLRTNTDWRDTVQFVGPDDEPVAIEPGTPLRMHVRDHPSSAYIALSLSTVNGRLIITDDPAGMLAFNVEDTEIAARLGPRDGADTETWHYDIIAEIDGVDRLLLAGTIQVEQGVTQK